MAVITGNGLRNRLSGTAAPDRIIGAGGDDILRGLGGNDTLIGGAGADTLDGGTGGDRMSGGTGNDTYIVDNSADRTTELAGQGTDTVRASITWALRNHTEKLVLTGASNRDGTGNALANTLTGNAGKNTLSGLAGDDVLNGGGGEDVLAGGGGGDKLNGGAGSDTADYSDSLAAGVVIDLAAGTGSGGTAQGDTLVAVENVVGTAFVDELTGNGETNRLDGLGGNDILTGGDGADLLNGGNDDDTLIGGAGSDALDGGGGIDTASYATSITRVFAFLNDVGSNTGDASGDTYDSIENLIGTNVASNGDSLAGNSGDNRIEGLGGGDILRGDNMSFDNPGFGNDTLLGGDGNDSLDGEGGDDILDGGDGGDFSIIGGSGIDTMTGGAGADVFRYDSTTDSGTGVGNRDIVTDFEVGIDRIQLWRMVSGLTFVPDLTTNGFSGGGSKEVGFTHESDTTIVQVDSDGDGSANVEIELTGVLILAAGDFVLANGG